MRATSYTCIVLTYLLIIENIMQKKIAVLLINWNGYQDTIECLESIQASKFDKVSVFVIDNYSTDDSVSKLVQWTKEYSRWSDWSLQSLAGFRSSPVISDDHLHIIQSSENLGFALGNNAIWEKIHKEFEYTLILNNDTVVTDDALSIMVETMDQNKDIAALSCDIRYYSDKKRLWRAGGNFAWYGDRKYFSQQQIDEWKNTGNILIETEFITGCVMMVRKSTSENIGLYTDKFFFGEEDFNYCQRLKLAGLRVSTILSAVVYHKVSGSIKKQQAPYNKFILHYTNRIINQKYFMGSLKWQLWRAMYTSGIYLRALKTFRNLKKANKVMQRIGLYTAKLDEVNHKTFIEISSLSADTV
jgi:GT2 family glycosyltransferase